MPALSCRRTKKKKKKKFSPNSISSGFELLASQTQPPHGLTESDLLSKMDARNAGVCSLFRSGGALETRECGTGQTDTLWVHRAPADARDRDGRHDGGAHQDGTGKHASDEIIPIVEYPSLNLETEWTRVRCSDAKDLKESSQSSKSETIWKLETEILSLGAGPEPRLRGGRARHLPPDVFPRAAPGLSLSSDARA